MQLTFSLTDLVVAGIFWLVNQRGRGVARREEEFVQIDFYVCFADRYISADWKEKWWIAFGICLNLIRSEMFCELFLRFFGLKCHLAANELVTHNLHCYVKFTPKIFFFSHFLIHRREKEFELLAISHHDSKV